LFGPVLVGRVWMDGWTRVPVPVMDDGVGLGGWRGGWVDG